MQHLSAFSYCQNHVFLKLSNRNKAITTKNKWEKNPSANIQAAFEAADKPQREGSVCSQITAGAGHFIPKVWLGIANIAPGPFELLAAALPGPSETRCEDPRLGAALPADGAQPLANQRPSVSDPRYAEPGVSGEVPCERWAPLAQFSSARRGRGAELTFQHRASLPRGSRGWPRACDLS